VPDNTVFVVDDDAAVRNGLKFLLHSAGYVAEVFASAQALLSAYDPEWSGCILLDVQMPSMTGPELQQELNRRGWSIPVIFITGHGTIPLAIEAIKAGAFDLIEKPLQEEQLLDCIRRALAPPGRSDGDRVLRAQLQARAASLTHREREVLALIAVSETSKVIARHLGISFRTVETHRAHIINKLHARGPADLIRFALIIESLAEP
jgi:two-component system, LuxR family, response regulator FixJ